MLCITSFDKQFYCDSLLNGLIGLSLMLIPQTRFFKHPKNWTWWQNPANTINPMLQPSTNTNTWTSWNYWKPSCLNASTATPQNTKTIQKTNIHSNVLKTTPKNSSLWVAKKQKQTNTHTKKTLKTKKKTSLGGKKHQKKTTIKNKKTTHHDIPPAWHPERYPQELTQRSHTSPRSVSWEPRAFNGSSNTCSVFQCFQCFFRCFQFYFQCFQCYFQCFQCYFRCFHCYFRCFHCLFS